MVKLNVIVVYDRQEKHVLMCLRKKEPYKGMYNLVGGKVEDGEDGLHGAYRELEEETGIGKADITLTRFIDFYYHLSQIELQVYVGRLNKDVVLIEEANSLHWIDVDDDFFDLKKYAGEGNIGHMIENVKLRKDQLLV